jgi:molybdate transport system ATP-binding protein
MVECSLDLRRGGFHLLIEARFAAEWTVLFGPSGSGKSTLLRLLAGLDWTGNRTGIGRADKTQILLDGNDLSGSKPGRRGVGMVAQQPALFPHLSVSANVAFGLHGLDQPQRPKRIEEMLALVGAEHLLNRRVQHLSGGEAQRIALARALAPMPRLLLLDEPFSALDGTASDALLERLQPWLCERSVQVIHATHDATDAFLTGAEVVLLHEGKLAAQGPAAEVLQAERERLERSLRTAQRLA